MNLAHVSFSIHSYDQDGDPYEYGIYVHFEDARIRVAETPEEFKLFAKRITGMQEEIEESFRDART